MPPPPTDAEGDTEYGVPESEKKHEKLDWLAIEDGLPQHLEGLPATR